MKYKELYLESQKRFLDKLKGIQSEYSKVRTILIGLENSIDSNRSEISPELYSLIKKELYKAEQICYNNM